MASFFLLLFADRFGRRLLLFVTVLGFGVVTGLTTLARDPLEFTALQTLARFFLLAEYALAVIVIGEEFPARLRGRAIGLLTAFSTIGVMVMAKVQPFVLLAPGAEGNWLHDSALAGRRSAPEPCSGSTRIAPAGAGSTSWGSLRCS